MCVTVLSFLFVWIAIEHCPDFDNHSLSFYLFLRLFHRMIDWLSWPLANHVDTWVIALLKGLAAVQKFTILIDVTVLKIELVNTGTDGQGSV